MLLRKICQSTRFLSPVFSYISTESVILSLFEEIRVRENRILAYFTQ